MALATPPMAPIVMAPHPAPRQTVVGSPVGAQGFTFPMHMPPLAQRGTLLSRSPSSQQVFPAVPQSSFQPPIMQRSHSRTPAFSPPPSATQSPRLSPGDSKSPLPSARRASKSPLAARDGNRPKLPLPDKVKACTSDLAASLDRSKSKSPPLSARTEDVLLSSKTSSATTPLPLSAASTACPPSPVLNPRRATLDLGRFHQGSKASTASQPVVSPRTNRKNVRLLIIGPGFGLKLNPRQAACIESAGYQVKWVHDLPNPEHPMFNVLPYLDRLRQQIGEFQPDVVAAASKGVAYVTGLWKVGYWRGPTFLINAHPTCTQIPEDVTLVLAHGSNDEVYPVPRADLERLVGSGGKNRTYLYYTANSGFLPTGHRSRVGDKHNMESLQKYELLPRLIDAALCPAGPELHMMRTWRERLSEERNAAERSLGQTPDDLLRTWASFEQLGMDEAKLFDVPFNSEEFKAVSAAFHAKPMEPSSYMLHPNSAWDRVQIRRLQRVENGSQMDGSTRPFHATLRRSLADQGLDFEPGVHTCWAFHGTDDEALESIVHDPLAGFQPLVSGTKGASLWGLGTYFARDARYVAEGGFCAQPRADGTRRMLMCLLSTGMACLGDPTHKGVLPFRQRPHRYHSTVDSLSSPEVYIMQHAGAAHPAYLITFA